MAKSSVVRKAAAKEAKESGPVTLAVNRRGRFDYEILQSYDAGLALLGSEVKATRSGLANIGEGYARFRDGELWLFNVHIGPYGPARENHEPLRPRKCLMHRRELERLTRGLEMEPRSTIIPLRLYLARGLVKVEVALARGKRSYDKRETIKEREADRTIHRALRHAQR